ncbi:MAG TPA: DUF2252 family protein [Thermoanaerobaculia bacterium]|nr:DUF2252 family protein [Thermoanaerobaculia bacterium]
MKRSNRETIHEATARYEVWLGGQLTLLPEDLEQKHAAMQQDLFSFLRATYYRWAQLWPEEAGQTAKAPEVLAVGDLHVENFGTWRDAEGRLVWGINDFDEASRLPYTNDLARLATSAHLAIAAGHLTIGPRDACAAILAGYRESLEKEGRPLVLAEHWHALRQLASARLKDPEVFWQTLDALPTLPADQLPPRAARSLADLLPEPGLEQRLVHRVAGLGSLGRQRFVVLADWKGARIAREAKAAAPSACAWAHGAEKEGKVLYKSLLASAVRCPDPFVTVKRRWILRRLAPDCSRVELSQLPQAQDETRLLHAMGWETANVHLGSRTAHALLLDLAARPADWLHESASRMRERVEADWEAWKAGAPEKKAVKAKAAKAPAKKKAPAKAPTAKAAKKTPKASHRPARAAKKR